MKIDCLDEKFSAAMRNLVEVYNDMGEELFDKILETIVIVLKKEFEKTTKEYWNAAREQEMVDSGGFSQGDYPIDIPQPKFQDFEDYEAYRASKK